MVVDPRLLGPCLDQAESSIGNWTRAFHAASGEAAIAFRIIDNAVRVLEGDISQQQELVNGLSSSVALLANSASRAAAAASDAVAEAQHSEAQANSAATQAAAAEAAWRAKLAEAQAEQTAAMIELSQAQIELQAAEFELSQAQLAAARARNELFSAEAEARAAAAEVSGASIALSNCERSYVTDEHGRRISPDCSYQRRRYGAAISMQSAAEERLRYAREELQQAIETVNAAQAHVVTARNRVQRAQIRLERATRRVQLTPSRVRELGRLHARANDVLVEAAAATRLALTAAADANDAKISAALAQAYVTDAVNYVHSAEAANASTKKMVESLEWKTHQFASLSTQQLDTYAAAVAELTRAREELSIFDSPVELG